MRMEAYVIIGAPDLRKGSLTRSWYAIKTEEV